MGLCFLSWNLNEYNILNQCIRLKTHFYDNISFCSLLQKPTSNEEKYTLSFKYMHIYIYNNCYLLDFCVSLKNKFNKLFANIKRTFSVFLHIESGVIIFFRTDIIFWEILNFWIKEEHFLVTLHVENRFENRVCVVSGKIQMFKSIKSQRECSRSMAMLFLFNNVNF